MLADHRPVGLGEVRGHDILPTKGQAVVIKIGQGAKPGIGGHLPGVKVTEPISETRRIPVGKDAISPAPHHDIYSIEDLGQRILGLKEATRKPIFVKVGATNYIPYIAAGSQGWGQAGIIIDGAGAGTGAAPSVVKNNVGIPIRARDRVGRHDTPQGGAQGRYHGHHRREGQHARGLAQANGAGRRHHQPRDRHPRWPWDVSWSTSATSATVRPS